MTRHTTESSPAPPSDVDIQRRQLIVDFWIALQMSGDAGATTWEVLDLLSDKVTECLIHDPALLARAESITAEAMLLINGLTEC